MEETRSLDVLEDIAEDKTALRNIGVAYAGRSGVLTSVLQYIYQTVALAGEGKAREGKELERLAAMKLYDLELLGTLIRRLGASPVYTACPPYPVSHYSASCVDYSKSLRSMLAADLALEESSAEQFGRIAAQSENHDVKRIFRVLIEDSNACRRRLEGMLGAL